MSAWNVIWNYKEEKDFLIKAQKKKVDSESVFMIMELQLTESENVSTLTELISLFTVMSSKQKFWDCEILWSPLGFDSLPENVQIDKTRTGRGLGDPTPSTIENNEWLSNYECQLVQFHCIMAIQHFPYFLSHCWNSEMKILKSFSMRRFSGFLSRMFSIHWEWISKCFRTL